MKMTTHSCARLVSTGTAQNMVIKPALSALAPARLVTRAHKELWIPSYVLLGRTASVEAQPRYLARMARLGRELVFRAKTNALYVQLGSGAGVDADTHVPRVHSTIKRMLTMQTLAFSARNSQLLWVKVLLTRTIAFASLDLRGRLPQMVQKLAHAAWALSYLTASRVDPVPSPRSNQQYLIQSASNVQSLTPSPQAKEPRLSQTAFADLLGLPIRVSQMRPLRASRAPPHTKLSPMTRLIAQTQARSLTRCQSSPSSGVSSPQQSSFGFAITGKRALEAPTPVSNVLRDITDRSVIFATTTTMADVVSRAFSVKAQLQ